jgi:hypothetical protein
MMRSGPIGLLSNICVLGGPHPCFDRLLDHPRCLDILERLLSFIGRSPEVLTAPQEEFLKQQERFTLAGVVQCVACFFPLKSRLYTR